MKVFIGLGNPTKEYESTRHNIGFMTIDAIAEQLGVQEFQTKFDGLFYRGQHDGITIMLLKPQTYMNNSGQSIRKMMDFFNVELADMYVFYDDMDIPFGDIRLKVGGSAGGHNGLKSIISHLGTEQFNRIRLGISRPERQDIVSYVLGKFSASDLLYLQQHTFSRACDFAREIQTQSFQQLMNTFNQKRGVKND